VPLAIAFLQYSSYGAVVVDQLVVLPAVVVEIQPATLRLVLEPIIRL
jgi:hypothetical protein